MAYEGTENLINIITELRDLVDVVIIAYQDFSYDGNPISDYDKHAIEYLRKSGLSDINLKVETDRDKPHREQETDKRNYIMEYAEKSGCSHVLIIDADEFYTYGSFLNALREIDKNNYEQTYCQYVNYYHDYQHYMVYPFKGGMYVPFVAKSCYRFKFDCTDFNKPSDPTRRYVRPKDNDGNYTVEYYVFPWNVVKMHHFSWVRKNIRNKLMAWSSKKCFDDIFMKTELAVRSFKNFDTEADVQDAKIIFNTPNNEIQIKKLPTQYVFPKYSFNDIDQMIGEFTKSSKRIVVLNLSSYACDGLFNILADTCKQTWVKQIEMFELTNIKYFSVLPGEKTQILPESYIIKVKDVPDNRSDVYQMLNRLMEAERLIVESGIEYDYIIRTNTSTWLNLPVLNELIRQTDNPAEMFGFRFDSAFWSQYNPYLEGQVLIISRYIMEALKYYLKEYELNKINNCSDDVIIGAVFSANQNKSGLPSLDFMKTIYGCSNKETDFSLSCPALQVKEFFVDNCTRLEIEPKRMKSLQNRFDNAIKKYNEYIGNSRIFEYPNLKETVQNIIKHKDDIILHVIEDTKTEWLTKSKEYKERARFAKIIDFTGDLNEMNNYICKLKQKGGYLKKN